MEYRDSKKVLLGSKSTIRFELPEDLVFESLELITPDLDISDSELAELDIDITQTTTGMSSFLNVDINGYPDSLEFVEIEIVIVGSVAEARIEYNWGADFSPEFIEDWA